LPQVRAFKLLRCARHLKYHSVMALFQASRRVLASVPATAARGFTSLGPREVKQTVRMTPSFGNSFSKKQSKVDLPQEATKDVQDHWNLTNGMTSKVPLEKTNMPNLQGSTVADLEKYVQLCTAEGGQSREDVLNTFEHFINENSNGATAQVAKKITVGEARKQKQPLPGGDFARVAYAEKLFSSIGGNFSRK